MRLSGFSGLLEFPVWRGQQGAGSAQRDHLLCGGLLLVMGGWIALSPPPKAPTLPSKCQARLRGQYNTLEVVPAKIPLVWVDTRSGLYYYPSNDSYGHTPGGIYLEAKEAKAKGYRFVGK